MLQKMLQSPDMTNYTNLRSRPKIQAIKPSTCDTTFYRHDGDAEVYLIYQRFLFERGSGAKYHSSFCNALRKRSAFPNNSGSFAKAEENSNF